MRRLVVPLLSGVPLVLPVVTVTVVRAPGGTSESTLTCLPGPGGDLPVEQARPAAPGRLG